MSSNTTGTLRVRDLARIEPCEGTLARAAAYLFRAFEIRCVPYRRVVIVALHGGAVTCDCGYRQTMVRPDIGATKAVAGDQHHSADSGRCGSAPRFADPLDGKCRLFGGARLRFEFADRWQVGINQIEIGKIMRQQACVGEAGELVFRRHPRHGDGPFGQSGRAVAGYIICGHHGLPAPDQHTQTNVVTFGTLRFLDPSVAHFNAQ